MPCTAEDWPIGAALLQFRPAQEASPGQWARVFREVAAEGFTHVDLTDTWVRPGDLTAGRRRDLALALKEAGLGVTAVSTVRRSVIDPDEETAADNLAYLLRTVEAAADLAVPVVGVGLHRPLTAAQHTAVWFWTEPGATDPVGDEKTWALAVERLGAIGAHAARHGVQVSLEMYEDTYLGTAESAARLCRDIGLPNVGLNPDLGNLVRLHRPVEDWERMLEITAPLANYWHIKNYYRDHDPATGAYFTVPAPAESGFIDYRRALTLALAAGFSGPVCVEHYGGDGLSVSARNRDYLRRILATTLGDPR
ncbi:sugar phosphate isomerase/epimerase family protein [Streptomyces sp. URMC 129]|uniref:sugar phosphate isomerase/epimerase family protein n=1 Tax=Streptomyces sp. URMC 129 TaxID=3423407 RepID=UPI003F1B34CC